MIILDIMGIRLYNVLKSHILLEYGFLKIKEGRGYGLFDYKINHIRQ